MAIRGLKAHTARLKALPDLAVRNVSKAVFAAAELIANEYALSITRGSVSGAGHVASKPGEAPNADTLRLSSSSGAVQLGPNSLKAEVISPVAYSVDLEFGTSKMAARPALRPARDKKKKEARDLVAKGLNAALKAARTK